VDDVPLELGEGGQRRWFGVEVEGVADNLDTGPFSRHGAGSSPPLAYTWCPIYSPSVVQ
jgi:hypothetical protein